MSVGWLSDQMTCFQCLLLFLAIRHLSAQPNDETVFLQSSIDIIAVTGGEMVLSAGTHIISSQLTNRTNVRIRGVGDASIIKRKDGTTGHIFVSDDPGVGNMQLRDFTIDQNHDNTGTYSYAVLWIGVTNCTIDHIHLINGRAGFVLQEGSTVNMIKNCVLDSYGTGETGAAIFLYRGCSNNIVRGNILNNGGTNTVGILVDDESGGTRASWPSTGNLIEGNILDGGQNGIGIEGSSQNIVQGNIIRRMISRAIYINPGANLAPSCNNIAQGNLISKSGGMGSHSLIDIQGCGNRALNNTITECLGTTTYGITINNEGDTGTNQSNNEISGNMLDGVPGVGIRIAPAVLNGLTMRGNSLRNIGDIGVYCTGTGKDWIFSCNVIEGNGPYGIYVTDPVPGLVDELNHISGFAVEKIIP